MNDNNNNVELMTDEAEGTVIPNAIYTLLESSSPSGDIKSNWMDSEDRTATIFENKGAEDIENAVGWTDKPDIVDGIRFLVGSQVTNIMKENRNGQTAMSFACMNGSLEAVRSLSASIDTDINFKDIEGNTPLMLAAQAGHLNIIQFLMWNFKELEVDAENLAGMTALMKAAIRGHSKCARTLLVAGADAERRDHSRNFRAFEWAMFCGFKKTANIIKNVGYAGPLHIQRQLMKPPKQTRFSFARDIYYNIKQSITSKFKRNQENWINEVGSLFYLVDSTIQPENVMQPLVWDNVVRRSDIEFARVELNGENHTASNQQSHATQRETADSESPVKIYSGENRNRQDLKNIPVILCTHASPTLSRKKNGGPKRQDSTISKVNLDGNLLQPPARKFKSKVK